MNFEPVIHDYRTAVVLERGTGISVGNEENPRRRTPTILSPYVTINTLSNKYQTNVKWHCIFIFLKHPDARAQEAR